MWFYLLFPVVVFGLFLWVKMDFLSLLGSGDRHQKCLESIFKMEKELFPELPAELYWAQPTKKKFDSLPAKNCTWGDYEMHYGLSFRETYKEFVSWPD
jgi:hypothetical protein